MILGEWRAEIRRDLRDQYVDYVRETGMAGYRSSAGNIGATIAVRDIDDNRSEIITLSFWQSMESIAAFSGEPINKARYFSEDDKYLLTRPDSVVHYDAMGSGALE